MVCPLMVTKTFSFGKMWGKISDYEDGCEVNP